MTRFQVDSVIDYPADPTKLCVTGHVLDGVIRAGSILKEPQSTTQMQVTAVQFQTPRNRIDGTITLLVDRIEAGTVSTGSLLLGVDTTA